MKKLVTTVITLMLVLSLTSIGHASNKAPKTSTRTTSPVEANESNTLLLRLDEINALDKSNLSATEKKALSKEVKSIKKTLSGNGIYISAGGIIIILLLIIILL